MRREKKNLVIKGLAITMTLAMMTAGCGSAKQLTSVTPETEKSGNGSVGALLLSVNPEVEISYDKQGMVVEVEGANEDGEKLLASMNENYEERECREVVAELVGGIYEEGYFANTVDGHEKNIILKLEEGSAYPDEKFLDTIAEEVRAAVEKCGLTSEPIMVKPEDLDEQGMIGIDKAKEIVLTQLGLTTAEFTRAELDAKDGVYELEFTVGEMAYEYEVNAINGKIVEAEFDTPNAEDANDTDDDSDDDVDDTDDNSDDDGNDADDDSDDDADNTDDASDDDADDADDANDDDVDDSDDADNDDDTDDADNASDDDAADTDDDDDIDDDTDDADDDADDDDDIDDADDDSDNDTDDTDDDR